MGKNLLACKIYVANILKINSSQFNLNNNINLLCCEQDNVTQFVNPALELVT